MLFSVTLKLLDWSIESVNMASCPICNPCLAASKIILVKTGLSSNWSGKQRLCLERPVPKLCEFWPCQSHPLYIGWRLLLEYRSKQAAFVPQESLHSKKWASLELAVAAFSPWQQTAGVKVRETSLFLTIAWVAWVSLVPLVSFAFRVVGFFFFLSLLSEMCVLPFGKIRSKLRSFPFQVLSGSPNMWKVPGYQEMQLSFQWGKLWSRLNTARMVSMCVWVGFLFDLVSLTWWLLWNHWELSSLCRMVWEVLW